MVRELIVVIRGNFFQQENTSAHEENIFFTFQTNFYISVSRNKIMDRPTNMPEFRDEYIPTECVLQICLIFGRQ